MTATVTLGGVKELQRAFDELKKSVANRVCRPALNKAAQLGAKKVKASVPSRYKGVRQGIGWRSVKTKYNSGIVSAKVGAGVGKRTKAKAAKQAITQKKRGGRKGVGFDAANIHWWFMGTAERETGTKRKRVGGKRGRKGWKGTATRVATGKVRRRTGRMPAQSDPISVILSRSASEINNVIRTWIGVGLKKEAERVKK